MRSRTLLLLLTASVLLGLAWAMVALAGEDSEPEPSRVGVAGETSTLPVQDVLTNASGEASDPARNAATRERLDAEGCVVLRVRVEDRVTGEPLPGARVSHLEGSHLEAFRTQDGREEMEDMEALAERLGNTAIADAQGLVSVPVRRTVMVAGRSGELYGEATLRWDPEQLPEDADRERRLRLERDVTLRVKVFDHRGVPAVDMPIEILPASAARRTRRDEVLAVRTGDQGIAWIPHWQVVVRERRWIRGLVDRMVVRGEMPGVASEVVTFDPAEPPAEILLRLPPTGRITVRAFDHAGPLAEYRLTLQVVPGDEEHDQEIPEVLGTREWTVPVSNAEPATFEHVFLGRRFRAQFRQDALKAVEVFSGPRHPGQEVSVALHAVVESAVLVGRAVDEDLEAIGKASLRFVYATEAGAGSRLIATDAAGRFRVNLGHATSQQALTKGELSLARRDAKNPASLGQTHLLDPRPLLPGEQDLGDVVLGEAALLASGRLLENLENPENPENPEKGSVSSANVDIAVERQRWRAGKPRWERDRIAAVGFPGPGRFEVRGVARSARYRLRVKSPRYLPMEPIEFLPGAKDLEVHLQRGGALRIALLVEEEIGAKDLVVELLPLTLPADGPMKLAMGRDRLRARAWSDDGELRCYRWDAVWPADYVVKVQARSGLAPLAKVPVQITAGEHTTLKDIDLRDRLRVVRLRVLGPDGRAIPDGNNLVLVDGENGDADTKAQQRRVRLRGGVARIVTGRPFADVVVLAEGFLPKRLRASPGDNTVLLETVPRVTVSIRGGLSSLPKGHGMGVRLVPRRPNRSLDGSVAPRRIEVNGTGSASVPVASDGWYHVLVYVSRGNHAVRIGRVDPGEVQVAAPRTAAVFKVRVPPEALREALAALPAH